MLEIGDEIFMEPPPVVDIGVLEAAKENIQPLASGRRAATLSAILSTPHAQREVQIINARKLHRLNIEVALQDEEGDPLETYVRFVHWTLDNYPQGQSAESGLLELLEEATRVLKDHRRGIWRGELKYLKLWLLYASFVEKPTLIFKFLLANDIGTSHAHLYEEYSAVLERAGRCGEADAIFLLGIARQAHPIEHLQGKHTEFQRRMMSGAPLPIARESATSDRRRAALGLVPSPIPLAGAYSPSLQEPVAGSNQSSRVVPTSRLQVFADPMGSGPDNDRHAFVDVGTRISRVKENIPKVQKAAGTTLRHTGLSRRAASSSGSSSLSKIVPYQDPDRAEIVEPEAMRSCPVPNPARNGPILPIQDPDSQVAVMPAAVSMPFLAAIDTPSSVSVAVAPGTIMKQKVVGSEGALVLSEAEALRKAPLKNYVADECSLVDSD